MLHCGVIWLLQIALQLEYVRYFLFSFPKELVSADHIGVFTTRPLDGMYINYFPVYLSCFLRTIIVLRT